LQTLSNPQYLATFESDVFAAGLVFGSLLLNGVHPFGVGEDEIISNIKINKPVSNDKSKSLLNTRFHFLRFTIVTFYHRYLFIEQKWNRNESLN
jgi:hypothetical protein